MAFRWGDSGPFLQALPKEKVSRDVAHMTSSTVVRPYLTCELRSLIT